MNSGTGPGAITPDGCAVELYALLGPKAEPDLIATALRPGGSILELGCGAGRVTHALIERGYRLTAVDQSPEMLARVKDAAVVLADIETLALADTFDAVLLGSYLIHTPSDRTRADLLATCRRHVNAGGVVLIERLGADFFHAAEVGPTREHSGTLACWRKIERHERTFSATIEYRHPRGTWTQTFTLAILSDDELFAALEAAGLRFECWLDDEQRWLQARQAQPCGGK